MSDRLEDMSLRDLHEMQSQVAHQIGSFHARRKQEALKAVQAIAAEHGFTLKQLMDAPKDSKASAPPKYANPQDPSATWTGRGRQPSWVKSHLETNGILNDLLIR